MFTNAHAYIERNRLVTHPNQERIVSDGSQRLDALFFQHRPPLRGPHPLVENQQAFTRFGDRGVHGKLRVEAGRQRREQQQDHTNGASHAHSTPPCFLNLFPCTPLSRQRV